jgi:hypothetical protein
MICLFLIFIIIHFFIFVLTLTKHRKNITLTKLALALALPLIAYVSFFFKEIGLFTKQAPYIIEILIILSGTNTAYIYNFATKENTKPFNLEPFYILNISSLSLVIFAEIMSWHD